MLYPLSYSPFAHNNTITVNALQPPSGLFKTQEKRGSKGLLPLSGAGKKSTCEKLRTLQACIYIYFLTIYAILKEAMQRIRKNTLEVPPMYSDPSQGQQQYAPQQPVYGQTQLEYVGVGRRFLAILIDTIILGVIGGILNAIFQNQTGLSGGITSILALVYFIILEATQGATLGKMALGLRVVKMDGSPITWSESIIRNLLRIIDGLFIYLVGAIFVWTSPLKQRLGDRAAHTVVVRRRS